MSNSISIANVSDHYLVDRLLRPDVADDPYGQSWQNSKTMSNSNYHRPQQVHPIELQIGIPLMIIDHSSTRRHHTSVDHPSSPARHNEPYVSRHQVDFLARLDVADNSYGRSWQNWGNLPDYSQSTREQIDEHEVLFEWIGSLPNRHQEAYMVEEEEDTLLRYFKRRTHGVATPKDGVNNPIETEEICAICLAEFEHEQIIGTLQCKHEYHAGCIKQWLLRKKDCPMCRASVLPFTST
ncbi:hypothetical protein P3S67_028764 [Capsicum chacoense]